MYYITTFKYSSFKRREKTITMKSTGLDQSNEIEVAFGIELASTFSCAFFLSKCNVCKLIGTLQVFKFGVFSSQKFKYERKEKNYFKDKE